MKKCYLLLSLLLSWTLASAQTGHLDYLDDIENWETGEGYTLSHTDDGELQVQASGVGEAYQTFSYTFPTLDLSSNPHVQISLRTPSSARVRIDLADEDGNVTNTTPTTNTVSENTFTTYTYDFTGKFKQTYPGEADVNPERINQILVYFNPAGNPNFTGIVYIDSLRIGSEADVPPPPKEIKLNQLGFYPNGPKLAIVVEAEGDEFAIVSADNQETVYQGQLSATEFWAPSGERFKRADFTEFAETGTFRILADEEYSEPFTIDENVHISLTKGLLKSYYYNRASMAIEEPWAAGFTRQAGHPDTEVRVHSSAATEGRPTGTIFSSSRGWYDAGDFNKYMVNSGITTYSILALYEHFPAYFDTLNTFIPESENNLPDILDEALWNVRWILTAQDPTDGSVYHKVTNTSFPGTVMPAAHTGQRYAVQRSTAAALNFTAVMAQSARIFRNFENELPGLADSCLQAAEKAYAWAEENPNVLVTENAAGVSTGVYGDNNVQDEFDWARMELYATTRSDHYYDRTALSRNFNVPGWRTVNTLGLVTMVNYRKQLNEAGYSDTTSMKNKLINLASSLRNHQRESEYRVVMGVNQWNFNWGSNAVAGNQGLILLQAYRLTKDESYLEAAIGNLDYVLGRNGTGYSYVTGFGHKSTQNPHHRISEADGIEGPIPGMVVGGANPQQNDTETCNLYTSSLPAKSYIDAYCSYASNEPAINYTSAVTYMAGGVEAARAGASYVPEYSEPPTSTKKVKEELSFKLFPNPADQQVSIVFENKGNGIIIITDATGKTVFEKSVFANNVVSETINISNLYAGIYIVSVITDEEKGVQKLLVR